MSEQYLAGVDFGTTGSRTVIYDLKGNEVGVGYAENPVSHPAPGAYEYDGALATRTLHRTTAEAIRSSGVHPRDIAVVCFSAIRGCFGLYDQEDAFVHPLILWPDTRGTETAHWMQGRLADVGLAPEDVYDRTGFPFFTGFTATRILWFRDAFPEKWERVRKIGSLQTVVQKAYGGHSGLDDAEDAGWFQQFDWKTQKPIPEIQQAWGLAPGLFADFVPAGTLVGKVSREAAEATGLVEGTPLACGIGDQQCTLLGTGSVDPGVISIYSGTCGVVVARTHAFTPDPSRILNVCGSAGGEWELEGTTTGMGGNYRWLRDVLGQDEMRLAAGRGCSVYEILNEEAAQSPPGSRGLLFLPYLSGADTPKLDRYARGGFLGANYQHRKPDFIRALIEGSTFELKTVMDVLRKTGIPVESFRFSGGGAQSALWNQMVADVFDVPVTNVAAPEATALGAAIIGGAAIGLFEDVKEASRQMVQTTDRWEPDREHVKVYAERFDLHQECYRALRDSGIFAKLSSTERAL
ncbi:MAG: hypothetical protein LBD12_00230 [Clostridiales Family XIII bacterium]|jgi:xylulokinase|nr:hypothetical protein [Clostridiales Family XIII bacterium]